MRVYGYRKPTLTVTLEEGGSLTANAIYYICGFYKQPQTVYTCISSPMSDIHTVTTTSTHRTIKITHKTFRDIQGFNDNGVGRTLVECYRHCLGNGNEIKIDSGSYAGAWTITFVDYHSFIIDTAYVDNVPTECYTDSGEYNRPEKTVTSYCSPGISNAGGISLYVGSTYPLSNSYGGGGAYYTDSSYEKNKRDNPIIITAQPARRFTGHSNLSKDQLDTGLLKPLADDYGTIYVEIDALTTLQEIHNEVQASGFIYHSYYGIRVSSMFMLVGGISLVEDGEIEATGANTTFIGGEVTSRLASKKISFPYGMVNTLPATWSTYNNVNIPNGIFYNNNSQLVTVRNIWGENASVFSTLRGDSGTGEVGDPVQWTNLTDGVKHSYSVLRNTEFKSSGAVNTYHQFSYLRVKLENVRTLPIYLPFATSSAGVEPDIYMFENTYIKSTKDIDGGTWHIRIYSYNTAQNKLRFLNIDTDDDDNKKLITCQNSGNETEMWFYRRAQFYLTNKDGNPVENAEIQITDGFDHIYSGTSNSTGYAYIDVIEQLYKRSSGDSAHLTIPNPAHHFYYKDFTITITHANYMTDTLKLMDIYGNERLVLSLNEPPVGNKIYGAVIHNATIR